MVHNTSSKYFVQADPIYWCSCFSTDLSNKSQASASDVGIGFKKSEKKSKRDRLD
jgi:hypothetical protein